MSGASNVLHMETKPFQETAIRLRRREELRRLKCELEVISARLSCLIVGGLAKHADQATHGGLEDRTKISLLGLRLTPCH